MIKKKYSVLIGLLLVGTRCVLCTESPGISDMEQESVTLSDQEIDTHDSTADCVVGIDSDTRVGCVIETGHDIETDYDTHEYDAMCSSEPESKSSAWKLMFEEVGFYLLSTCVRVHMSATKKYESFKRYIHRLTTN